jgi:hypothetical protein
MLAVPIPVGISMVPEMVLSLLKCSSPLLAWLVAMYLFSAAK